MSYKKVCILFCSIFFLTVSLTLSAQEAPSDNKLIAEEINPIGETNAAALAASVPAISSVRKELPANTRFEDLDIKKYETQTAKQPYRATEIERSYFMNNPFDMEDLSNPFNLPRLGSNTRLLKRKKQKEEQPGVDAFVKDLFAYKSTPKKTVTNKQPTAVAPFWILFSLLSLLSLFTYMLVSFKADIKKMLQAFTNASSAGQQYREQKNIFTPFSLFSYLLFVLTMGHFAYLGSNFWVAAAGQEPDWSFSSLLLAVLGMSGIYLMKHGQIRLISLIFPFKQQLEYYSYIISNNNKVLGLALTPLLFLLVYSPDPIRYFTLYTALVLLGGNYLYRYIRSGIAASDAILYNKFHFIIYLCSVEIAPVLILLKLLSII